MQKFAALVLVVLFGFISTSAKADFVVYDIFIDNISPQGETPNPADYPNIANCGGVIDLAAGYAGCFGGDFDDSNAEYIERDGDGNIIDIQFAFNQVNDFFLELFFQGSYVTWMAGEAGMVAFDSDFRVHTFKYTKTSNDIEFDADKSGEFDNDNGIEATVTEGQNQLDFTADVSFEQQARANVVPEPAGIFVIAMGLVAMISLRRKA